MPTNPPLAVVGFLEGQKRQPEFLDGLEAANPEKIFLEDTDKAFGDAVALRLAHVRRRVLDAEKGDLLLEVIGDELAAVVVPQGQPPSHILAESPKTVTHTLPDRLLKEPLPEGPHKGKVSRVPEMLPRYYEARGWDAQGVPTPEKLAELGLA